LKGPVKEDRLLLVEADRKEFTEKFEWFYKAITYHFPFSHQAICFGKKSKPSDLNTLEKFTEKQG
jgi:hypothetical protein